MDVTILAKLQIFSLLLYNDFYSIKDRNDHFSEGVLHGSVVECFTCNPGALGSSCTGSCVFFMGVSLGSLLLVKPKKDMDNGSCGRAMTEILLKAA